MDASYTDKYGSLEIDAQPLKIRSALVAADAMSVKLAVEGRRRFYVHQLKAAGFRARDGAPLLHPAGWYTLNELPK